MLDYNWSAFPIDLVIETDQIRSGSCTLINLPRNTNMQTISVETETQDFFCPITGTQLCGDSVSDISEDTFSKTSLVAMLVDELGLEPVWARPAFGETLAAIKAEQGEDDDWLEIVEALEKMDLADNFVLFEVKTHGFACGPVSSITYFLVDFSYEADTVED